MGFPCSNADERFYNASAGFWVLRWKYILCRRKYREETRNLPIVYHQQDSKMDSSQKKPPAITGHSKSSSSAEQIPYPSRNPPTIQHSVCCSCPWHFPSSTNVGHCIVVEKSSMVILDAGSSPTCGAGTVLSLQETQLLTPLRLSTAASLPRGLLYSHYFRGDK